MADWHVCTLEWLADAPNPEEIQLFDRALREIDHDFPGIAHIAGRESRWRGPLITEAEFARQLDAAGFRCRIKLVRNVDDDGDSFVYSPCTHADWVYTSDLTEALWHAKDLSPGDKLKLINELKKGV